MERKRMKTDFVCPKCRGELSLVGGSKRCALGHTFDRARAGYYNLLLGSAGGVHGDNAEMVEARRRFLSTGAYQPLCDRLSAIVCERVSLTVNATTGASFAEENADTGAPLTKESTATGEGITVLDCGCGEGYYTSAVCAALDGAAVGYSMLAFDISRDAAKLAARCCPSASVAVASCYSIPVADSSVDIALNIFSPLAPDEVRRVLRPKGAYAVAYPGENHLFDLKAAIYDKPYKNTPDTSAPEGFALLSRERVEYTLSLDTHEKIADLFMMTPYAYRTGRVERERLASLEKLTTRVEFLIDIYEKYV